VQNRLTRRQFARYAGMAAASRSILFTTSALAAVSTTYQNPILSGDHPDASPIRVGGDFYLTHSSFDYAPGLLIWHSPDLINWRPVAAVLRGYYGRIFAPYFCEYRGRFYIYFPASGVIHAVYSDHPEGPWSEPVSLGIKSYDPAHIAEDGHRYLYLSDGSMAELTPDGLGVKVPPRHVVDPWPLPASIRIECTCLEGPKLIEHNGYFYLNVAEGGSAGPATSHSVISARSRHATGPWEFSQHNPVIHTGSRDERWLSVGHGRLVDTADGKWFITVHAYENGYRTLGRQLLLLPVEWTADGWWRVPKDVRPDSQIRVPIAGTKQKPFLDPSDGFQNSELGLQWQFWHEFNSARFSIEHGALTLQAQGSSIQETSVLTTPVGGHSYTVEVDVEVSEGCESGLLLFYNPSFYAGVLITKNGIRAKVADGGLWGSTETGCTRATLRIVNDRQELDFYYRLPGQEWRKTEASAEISGLNHNVLGGFLDVRPALCAYGNGRATFRTFGYWPEAKAPA
jgi:xylan 1,4-beta-xylosidase